MTFDPDLARRVLRQVASGTDVGAVLRGMFALGWVSPMQKLFARGGDWARLLDESQMHYFLLAGPAGAELSRARAVAAIDDLLARLGAGGSGLTGPEYQQVLNLLMAQRYEMTDGWRALGHAQALSARPTLETTRALDAAARALARGPAVTAQTVLDGIADLVRPAVLDARRAGATGAGQEAMRLFTETVRPSDSSAWRRIHEKIEEMGIAPGTHRWTDLKAKADAIVAAGKNVDTTLLKLFRGQVSSLKGLANEIWFYASRAWARLEPQVQAHAVRRGTLLGGGWEPLVLEQPLFRFDPATGASLEILDGSSFLTRPAGSAGVSDALLDVGISAKLEREGGVTVLSAVARDIAHLVPANPGTPILHTADGSVTLLLRPAPDQYLPAYIAVAPELPRGFRATAGALDWDLATGGPARRPAGFAPLPGGMPVLFVPTLLSGAQGDAAFLLVLKALFGVS